ncbi:hypothetical protein D3Z60_24490 [Lachnospiraceae bacterium]|nr:hypothetical protein [Lachnospiraceae bacterium]
MNTKFMRESINKIIAIIFVGISFIGIWQLLRYMIVDDTKSYTRLTLHEYYNQENIDVLFIGASLCYRSLDTQILDESLGMNTFNLGTSSQDMDASYYLIKDAIKRYNVRHIYLELSPVIALHTNNSDRELTDMTGTYIVSDYMKPSISKAQYLLEASKPDYYINSFLLARRNWEKLFDFEYVGSLLETKSSTTYKNFEYGYSQNETEYYAGKGYVANTSRILDNSFYDPYGFKSFRIEGISKDWYKYLNKILKLCDKSKVEITLFCAPLSVHMLASYGDEYDKYHDLIEQMAEDKGKKFWDFNLCKETYFPIESNLYKDSTHLNMYGAEYFSKLMSDIIRGKVIYENICYNSVSEKLNNIKPMVCGITYNSEYKKIIATHKDLFEYRIYVIPNEGNAYLIQDFDFNNEFRINFKEHGTISITARFIKVPSDIQKLEFKY